MDIFQIVSWIIWIVAFVLLLTSKHKFNQPESKLSIKSIILFIIPTFFISVVFLLYITGVYIKAYNPDYEYDKTAKIAGYHIYKPNILSDGLELDSRFYIYEKNFAGKNNAVRVAYAIPINKLSKGEKSHLLLVTQAQVDQNFDIPKFLEKEIGKPFDTLGYSKITINKWPDQPAFIKKSTNDSTTMLYILAPDNVLILLGSLNVGSTSLLKIAETLQ